MQCINTNGITGLFTNFVEVWKDIVGYEGYYQISNQGKVKSLARFRKSKGGCIAPLQERIMKIKVSKCGYEVLHLRADELGLNTHPSIHRLIAESFIDNPDNKPTVNHKDGNKRNNIVSNLEWATVSEQVQHAFDTGLITPRGKTKFSKAFQKEVFNYYVETGCSIMSLSKHFEISERTAGRFAKGDFGKRNRGEKLTEENVKEIIKLREDGNTLSFISKKFSCGISQIHRISRGESRNLTYER